MRANWVNSLARALHILLVTTSAEAAQRFVTGKLFAFSCLKRSRGLGKSIVMAR
jgi:hypothetical protein